jgi:hypothetical protein
MIKHRIIRTEFDKEAEEHLDRMEAEGWYNSNHFFEDGTHIMVFERNDVLEAIHKKKGDVNEVFSEAHLINFKTMFGG